MSETPFPRLFVFGLGYTGARLARAVRADGWTVAGTCRDGEAADRMRADGIMAYPFDRGRSLPTGALDGATHLLASIPPDAAGDPVLDAHGADIAGCTSLRWVGYLSTTGVYGDRAGAWVDESDEPQPLTERARRRVAAEERWRAVQHAGEFAVQIFRLAGIYGPGRSALDQLRSNTARRIVKPGHAFARIHVDDIVGVLRASMAHPVPGAIYNVCDDEPAPSSDVVAFACGLLGVALPPEIPFDRADLSPIARSFYAESRRVSNARLKDELGVRLRYPDYRAGLRAIQAEELQG